jgi:hypothetical protein
MSVVYPTDFPIAETLELVGFLRNGQIAAHKSKFAYNLWLLEGFALKSVLGDPFAPTPTTDVVTPSAVPEGFNAADELEKLCQHHADGTFHAQVTVPWKKILQWAVTELGTILLAA